MANIVKKLIESYNHVFTDLADPRTNNYFLIPSPLPILTLTGAYLYISLSLGPRWMKDRPPYKIKHIVLLYNVFQVMMSTYVCYEGTTYMLSEEFSLMCDPIDYSRKPRAMKFVNAGWWYFFSKVTEFLDTVFFVLRKKNNQISFLHVYHHSMMAFMMWIGIKYLAGGHAVVMGTLNAFVHIIMYTYYFLAGLGPQYQKYLWWKKHVTVLQLAQFVIILIHNLNALFSDCTYPKIANILMIANALLFINLFGKFFYASYIMAPAHKNTAHNKIKLVTNGSTTNGSATNGSAKNGSATNGTATKTNGSATNGLATNGEAKNGAYNAATNGHSMYDAVIKNNGVHANGKHKEE